MALARATDGHTNGAHQGITRDNCRLVRAGLIGTTSLIDLASGDTCQPDLRPFRAPDRAIAIPDPHRGASELGSIRDDRRCKKHHRQNREPPLSYGGLECCVGSVIGMADNAKARG